MFLLSSLRGFRFPGGGCSDIGSVSFLESAVLVRMGLPMGHLETFGAADKTEEARDVSSGFE